MATTDHPLTAKKLYSISICFHLLLLLLLVCSGIAVSQSTVKFLPGFAGPLPFELETGYVGVDDDVQLFYYFIKSETNPREDPLLLWTCGGPRCSAISILAFGLGPIYFKIAEYNGSLPTLMLNPNSWTKVHLGIGQNSIQLVIYKNVPLHVAHTMVANIIFLDAPVGTGFSYSRSIRGFNSGDKNSAKQTYNFLRKWLIDHPEYLSNPLYVGGESYSGMITPIIVQDISDGIDAGHEPRINLKGYLLGNPITDRHLEMNSEIQFAYGMGLISKELYESTKKTCGEEYVIVDPSNAQCKEDLQAVSECTSGLDDEYILDPKCLAVPRGPREGRSLDENSSKFILSQPPPFPALDCKTYGLTLAYYWANNDSVQEALNIRKEIVKEWVRCNHDLPYIEDIKSSVKYHQSLSNRGYRSLIYSGDHDMVVPSLSTQAWIRSLNYSIIDDWRPWFVNDQVGGYTRTYSNNMTFATVKGAGHVVQVYKPKESFDMFKRWISHNPL